MTAMYVMFCVRSFFFFFFFVYVYVCVYDEYSMNIFFEMTFLCSIIIIALLFGPISIVTHPFSGSIIAVKGTTKWHKKVKITDECNIRCHFQCALRIIRGECSKSEKSTYYKTGLDDSFLFSTGRIGRYHFTFCTCFLFSSAAFTFPWNQNWKVSIQRQKHKF